MGQREQAVMRKMRVADEGRFVADPAEQNAGERVGEIGVAEGGQPGVVQQTQGETGRRVQDRDQPAHAIRDAQIRTPVLFHQRPNHAQGQERVHHELAIGFQRDIRLRDQFVRHPLRFAHRFDVGPNLRDARTQFLGRHDDHFVTPDIARMGGGELLGGPAVVLGAAQGQHSGAARVLQSVERPQPPEHIGVFVHHDVIEIQMRLSFDVFALPEQSPMGDLVPEVNRTGLVADEEDVRFARGGQLFEPMLRPAGAEDEQHIRLGLGARAGVGVVVDPRQRLELERKLGLTGQHLELVGNPLALAIHIGGRPQAAIGSPTGLFTGLVQVINQQRFDPHRLAERQRRAGHDARWHRARRPGFKPRQRAEKRRGAGAFEKAATIEAGTCGNSRVTVGYAHARRREAE